MIIVRKFNGKDRAAVRKISLDTAFMGKSAAVFFNGSQILADALTLYFTDYEPDSCFVATKDNQVVGYLIGSKNVAIMRKFLKLKILPQLFLKSITKGIFLKAKNVRFFIYCMASFLQGEFFVPDFTDQYPATLHININNNFRGLNIGKSLMEHYLSFLKENSVSGVHCSTSSSGAKQFFIKEGFHLLFQKKISYWKHYSGKNTSYYALGKKL